MKLPKEMEGQFENGWSTQMQQAEHTSNHVASKIWHGWKLYRNVWVFGVMNVGFAFRINIRFYSNSTAFSTMPSYT